jgi:hypothetical protein
MRPLTQTNVFNDFNTFWLDISLIAVRVGIHSICHFSSCVCWKWIGLVATRLQKQAIGTGHVRKVAIPME